SRMAWQAVSEAMRVRPNFNAQHHISELKRVSESLNMSTFMSNLFLAKDAYTFEKQLDAIVSLLSILLNSKSLPDNEIEKAFDLAPPTDGYKYTPRGSISPTTEHLFFEAKPGHSYLFDTYGNIKNSQILLVDGNPWGDFAEQLTYLRNSLGQPSIK